MNYEQIVFSFLVHVPYCRKSGFVCYVHVYIVKATRPFLIKFTEIST